MNHDATTTTELILDKFALQSQIRDLLQEFVNKHCVTPSIEVRYVINSTETTVSLTLKVMI